MSGEGSEDSTRLGIESFSLSGKVALVTGGNGGLGRAMALGLRAAGATIAVTGRDPAKNKAIAKELGGSDAVFSLEVRDEEAVERTVAGVLERFGRLDVMVNNAGLFRRGSVLELSREDWEAVLDSHLAGTFLCSKHAARAMVDCGEGGRRQTVRGEDLPRAEGGHAP